MINEDSYIKVHSFMVTDLKLKGNELLIFALIYGYTKKKGRLECDLKYLCEWTCSTKQGVLKCVKSLIQKGYIIKNKVNKNGVNKIEYRSTKFNYELNKVYSDVKQSLPPIKQSLILYNKYNNNINNIIDIIIYIVDFLNKNAGTCFKSEIKQTQDLIKARLSEGFTVADFETVIKNKCSEWQGTKMAVYLRPQTLFGEKFESYLNEPKRKAKDEPAYDLDEFELAALRSTPKGVKNES